MLTIKEGVFLRYSLKDRKIVDNIYFQLRGNGNRPWIDHEDIDAGEE